MAHVPDDTRTLLAVFDDDTVIPYRPRLVKAVGQIDATILLQQIRYWWVKMGRRPFFKFKEGCNHPLYRPGDSWTEELGFTRREFDSARSFIAWRKPTEIDLRTAEAKVLAGKVENPRPVLYYVNTGHVTYYHLIEPLFITILRRAYAEEPTAPHADGPGRPTAPNAVGSLSQRRLTPMPTAPNADGDGAKRRSNTVDYTGEKQENTDQRVIVYGFALPEVKEIRANLKAAMAQSVYEMLWSYTDLTITPTGIEITPPNELIRDRFTWHREENWLQMISLAAYGFPIEHIRFNEPKAAM